MGLTFTMNRPGDPDRGYTQLDRWFENMLGDRGPQHFGSGWFSGLVGLLLGAGSLLAVLVFHFPEWLSFGELRTKYPVGLMRGVLTLAIIAAFFFSALNLLLRPRKRLGLAGIALACGA